MLRSSLFVGGQRSSRNPALAVAANVVCNANPLHLETSIKKTKFAYKIKTMKTISVSISDLEYNQFGINNDRLSFTEFVDLVNKEITKQTLNRCIQLAEKYKLSRMSMDEITDEVKAIRNAKSNH